MNKFMNRLLLRNFRLAGSKAMVERVIRTEQEATIARELRKPLWDLQKTFFQSRVKALEDVIGEDVKE